MANITISDLRPAGADLFSDSESYLNDLTELQMMELFGGAGIYLGLSYKAYPGGLSIVFCAWA